MNFLIHKIFKSSTLDTGYPNCSLQMISWFPLGLKLLTNTHILFQEDYGFYVERVKFSIWPFKMLES